jgi:hypothetical protein
MLSVLYAECHSVELCSVELRYAICCYAERRYVGCIYVIVMTPPKVCKFKTCILNRYLH